MRLLGSTSREAIGLHVDGQQVQVAHIRREGKRVLLLGLDTATLVTGLDQAASDESDDSAPVDTGDILGLTEDAPVEPADVIAPEEDGEEGAPETNSELLNRLLDRFPVNQASLAVSLSEGRVFYTSYDDSFGLKGKRLKARLMEEAGKERTFEGSIPLGERHAFTGTGQGGVLSIVHEDRLEVLNLLDELKPFLGRVQIGRIEPLEITLMNLVKTSYPPDEHVTAIVFMGESFSRVLFMQNGNYLAFSQPIHEGANGSRQGLQTVFRRILLQQDVSELPEVGRVLLAGRCRAAEAQAFFSEQFPDAQVDYLSFEGLDLSRMDDQDRDLVSGFAVPIGLAWGSLLPRTEKDYVCNFLPKARRRMQNPLEIAWHGLALVFLLVTSVLFLGVVARDRQRAIEASAMSVGLLAQQVEENRPYVKLVDDLHAQIGDYERNFSLIDALSAKRLLWSPELAKVTRATRSVGGLWLDRLSTSPEAVLLYGKAANLAQAPRLADRLGGGHIQSVVRSSIRGKTIYGFEMRAPATPSGEGH